MAQAKAGTHWCLRCLCCDPSTEPVERLRAELKEYRVCKCWCHECEACQRPAKGVGEGVYMFHCPNCYTREMGELLHATSCYWQCWACKLFVRLPSR